MTHSGYISDIIIKMLRLLIWQENVGLAFNLAF